MRNLINVAVVLLMLVLATGLALSWRCKLQQAAERTQCGDNLRALVMALHNHCDQHGGHFPAGTIPNEDLACDKRLSWLVSNWGYDEQVPRLLIDKKKAWDGEENRIPRTDCSYDHHVIIEAIGDYRPWLCPSNPTRGMPGWPGVTHYVGVAGVGVDAESLPAYAPQAGIFGCDRSTRLADIKDGTSNTLILMETAWENGPWTAGGAPTVRGLEPKRQPYLGSGRPFGGSHPGVAGVAFADGSARFLSHSIRPEVLEALATVAGGEGIDPREWQ